MTPEVDFDAQTSKVYPSKTYKVDLTKKRIIGYVDGLEAIIQAVVKNFYTERYAYVIYSPDYGIEIEQYIAQDFDYIKSDIQRTVRECLANDDRITGMYDFNCELGEQLDSMLITFRLGTVDGVIDFSQEVTLQ